MNIIFLAAECAPFVKVGGLGDVIGTLPEVLAKMGHSVHVFVPHHGVINDKSNHIKSFDAFSMSWNGTSIKVRVAAVKKSGVDFYFLRGLPYFSPEDDYVYHEDDRIDVGRYLFFTAAALEFATRLARRGNWKPDVIHINDWHTAGLPYLLAETHSTDPMLSNSASVLTIHNMQYQGWGVEWHLKRAGLPVVSNTLLRAAHKTDCLLALGIAYSSVITTVSPHYAEEIASPDGGFGLDDLIHVRSANLFGILNGIDFARWDPETSLILEQPFNIETIAQRQLNKLALQTELGLKASLEVPLVGAVTRLVDQKGPSVILSTVRRLLDGTPDQFVLLGTGMDLYEQGAIQLGLDFADRASINVLFDEALSERIYAGIDLFLMPSEFEPCGIGQMIAMRYGAVPVVNRVGGLIDTVDEKTGFLMSEYSVASLDQALANALNVYDHDQIGWRRRQVRGMKKNFSWEASARKYLRAYRRAIALHKRYSST